MMKMYRVKFENGVCSPWSENLAEITARATSENGVVEVKIFNFLIA